VKIHMVKQGDTLYLIAKKYNVSLEDIINANPEISNPNAIEVGTKVKIPSQQKTPIEVIHQHIVQQGDSLWKLSKSWGTQLADLIKVNPQLKNPNALLTGEVVNIPKPTNGAGSPGVMIHGNPMPGKANTGLKPGTGLKIDTGIKPNTGIPMPLPTPQPMPLPTPITPTLPIASPPSPIMPIAEKKPTYGFEEHEHMDLFKQYPVPTLPALAPAEMHYFPDTFPHDYGMQQPLVSPESAGVGKGYGYPQNVSPSVENAPGNVAGMYGYHMNDFIGYGVNNPSYSAPYSPSNFPTNVQGMTSPLGNCNCGAASYPSGTPSPYGISPYSTAPYANMPQQVSPYENMPQQISPYANMPQQISPYANMPQQISPYANTPQQVSPYENMPQQISPYANIPQQVSPYANMPQQISPYANMPQQISPYENMPQQFSPYGGYPGMNGGYPNMHYGGYPSTQAAGTPTAVSPAAGAKPGIGGQFVPGVNSPASDYGYPIQGYSYNGGIPSMPPMPPMFPQEVEYDDRSTGSDEDVTATASSVKKRSAKPKPKQKAPRQNKPRHKENLPWIKW
jgi:morphogenetic protein associated with SpoVID